MNTAQAPQQQVDMDVELAQQGDMQAYARLIQHCQNVVTSIALAIVKDIDDSEEVAQQVFIATWENLSQLKNKQSFLPWIRQSTRYTAFNFLRDNKSNKRISSEQADDILAHISDADTHSEEQLILENQNRVLQNFIDQLPSDDREIVLLYYREEQSSKQVAQLLNLSQSNVRKKLQRVRQMLKSDVLKNASHLIYSTAPAVGFSALITGMLVPSAPVAAAVIASTSAKANTSFVVKIAAIVGGALLGAFIAVFAVMWSSNMAIKNVPEKENKLILKRYRNETIAWLIALGIAFSASYELSDGWIAPLVTYTILVFGLTLLSLRTIAFIIEHAVSPKDGKTKLTGLRRKIACYTGLIVGITAGFAGIIVGLIEQGRMPW